MLFLPGFQRNGQWNRRLSGVRHREMFLQGIGRKFLAHARAVQHASRAVVDERGPIDAPFLRVTQYGVDALGFEHGDELFLVIRCGKYGKDGALRHVGELFILDLLLGANKLPFYGFIADSLSEK